MRICRPVREFYVNRFAQLRDSLLYVCCGTVLYFFVQTKLGYVSNLCRDRQFLRSISSSLIYDDETQVKGI